MAVVGTIISGKTGEHANTRAAKAAAADEEQYLGHSWEEEPYHNINNN